MRTPLLLLPIAALFASLPVAAQDAPRVIFCQGQCFAVDPAGNKTPAPKGTQLLPGQRLETGAGTYAQVKLGSDAALGVGDNARVRFDLKSFRDRDVVFLDQGRLRVLGGDALGKHDARPVELRTKDGSFALRNADMEVKRGGALGDATFMKLNTGDARLQSGQGGDVVIGKLDVQSVTAGRLATGLAVTEFSPLLTPVRTTGLATTTITPVATAPVAALPTISASTLSPAVLSPALSPITAPIAAVTSPSTPPTVPVASTLLAKPVQVVGTLVTQPGMTTAGTGTSTGTGTTTGTTGGTSTIVVTTRPTTTTITTVPITSRLVFK